MNCVSLRKGDPVVALVLLAALAFPPQQSCIPLEAKDPVQPEQVLAWQLEGLTQEEIRDEVGSRGLTEHAEEPLLNALSAAGADAETILTVRHARGPRILWKLGLRLPKPTDYLYEVAGAVFWKDRESALQTLQNEAEKQPRNPDVRLIHAFFLRVEEDWIAAYGEATEAVALAPQSPYAHGLRSTICYYSQLSECALREARVFVELRPQDGAAYIVLGHAKELQGKYEEALQAFAEAKRLHAGYSAIYEGMGRVHGREGEFEKAVAAYEQAIRMDGERAEYYRELGLVYAAEGYWKKAVESLKQAKELEPDRPEILLALGNAYLAAGAYPEAIHEFQELMKEVPDMELARSQLAKALRAEGRGEEAAQMDPEPPTLPSFAKPR